MNALLAVCLMVLPLAPALAGGSSYSVVSVEGGALSSAGKPLEAGANLTLGEKVTLSGGTAVLRAGDAGKLLLKGPAELVLTGASSDRAIDLRLGSLLSALPRLKGRFSVRTAQTVAAVRGTEFFVEAKKLSTYVCVCEGAVDAKPAKGRKGALAMEATHADRHHAWTVKRVNGGMLAEAAAFQGHSDEELSSLRAP